MLPQIAPANRHIPPGQQVVEVSSKLGAEATQRLFLGAGGFPEGLETTVKQGGASQTISLWLKNLKLNAPMKAEQFAYAPPAGFERQKGIDESLLAVGVMADRPGFGWTRLLHRLADGQSFADAIGNFGFSYADLEAPFTR